MDYAGTGVLSVAPKPTLMKTSIFLAGLLFAACGREAPAAKAFPAPPLPIINPSGNTMQSRIRVPADFERVPAAAGSYTAFLRDIALRPDGAVVHYYNGGVKQNTGIYSAVLDYDAGTSDLQQCADAVMRIRAEYLYAGGRKDRIAFRLTSGFRLDYRHWMDGYRPKVAGNKVQWSKDAAPGDNPASFRKYLDAVFTYAGTLSLSKQLKPVAWTDLQPGDVLIVGGSPGHAVTVMDVAVSRSGRKLFLLSQSYMPAQEIQVLQNPGNPALSPWYELDPAAKRVVTPQWIFTTDQLMRFGAAD